MKRKRFESVWDAIEDSATEAASMKLRAELASEKPRPTQRAHGARRPWRRRPQSTLRADAIGRSRTSHRHPIVHGCPRTGVLVYAGGAAFSVGGRFGDGLGDGLRVVARHFVTCARCERFVPSER